MRLIRWSVDNSGTVFAFYLGVLVLAALSLWRLVPMRLTPALQSPQVAVITEAMGMPALLVERHLTDPLEKALAGVPGVISVRSSSMEGMSVIIVEFPYDHDLRSGAEAASAALASVDLGLDDESSGHAAMAPRVVPYDPLRIPVLRLAVKAPSWDPAVLASFIETELTGRLKKVGGVESVWTFGSPRQQISVLVNRDNAAAAGLGLVQVVEAIDAANSAQSAGALHDVLTRTTPVQLDAQARTAADLESIVVAAPANGPPVTLKDIATVDLHLATNRSLYRYNRQEAIEVNIVEGRDASSPRTVADLRVALKEIQREHPGLEVEEAYDNAHFVAIVARNVWLELALAVALTGLVTYLFLGEWRGTLVVLATVPASLACAVLFFAPLGLSFNSSTLIGLLLAIGRLVDDTIIDLCSVARQRAQGKSAREAAIDGCSAVRRAVVSATVVICLVMLPLTFAGGLTQDMFEGIVWPFLLALAASLVVALTLAPCLIARLYVDAAAKPPRSLGLSERILMRLESRYRSALGRALRYRGTVLCGALAALYLAFAIYPRIGWEMMPLADTGQIYAALEARPGTPASETGRLAEKLETILLRQPEVVKVSTEVGPGGPTALLTGYGTRGPNSASMMITLRDKSDRQRSIWQIIDAVYLEATLTIPHLRQLSLKEMGSDVMASAMAPVELVIRGPEVERLAYLAEQTRDLARQSKTLIGPGGLTQISTTWSLEDGGWSLRPKHAALAALGLSPEELARQASLALEGAATRTTLADGTPIMLSYPADQRRTFSDLQNVKIQGSKGSRTLAELADIEPATTPGMIEHDNLQRSNSVIASYRQGGAGSMQLGMDWLMASRMRVGFPPGYTIEQRGDMLAMMDSSRRLFAGMGLAIVLMYLALAAQFRSAALPLAIMAAIPLSLPGVFAALLLAGQTISTVSLLGLAVLIGMDVTASILLLDAVAQQRAQGRSTWRALLIGAPERLRPVLMTVLVTLAVMAPLALFPATGMDAYAPLATVVMGGLAVSGALTLFVVPVLYSFFGANPAHKTS
jgi:HAE1 family hydrophobic/amphiphilic exporter-1